MHKCVCIFGESGIELAPKPEPPCHEDQRREDADPSGHLEKNIGTYAENIQTTSLAGFYLTYDRVILRSVSLMLNTLQMLKVVFFSLLYYTYRC